MMYHVMIIEDDPMVASINRQYVEATPSFQADRVFKSGAEALEYLKNHTTDLIILDYYTPLMNGDVFIDRLHALERFAAQQEYLQGARSSLSQSAIDQLFAGPDPTADSVPQLSKGLNEATLSMIRRFLADHPEGLFTSEQIAEQIHLSRITIRRYMNYLVDIGEIVSSIDYKTGGRPSIQYSLGRRDRTL